METPSPADWKPLGNIHHAAYRCRDAEQTRWFYQDILGLKLAAAFEDEIDVGEGGRGNRQFMHIFFELADGNYIAFFDEPGAASEDNFNAKDSFDQHIAFEAESEDAMAKWQKALNEQGVMCFGPIDHGFVKSVYMYDPNGIPLEITCKVGDYPATMKNHAGAAKANIEAWCAKTRAIKEDRIGAEHLDKRI